MPSGDASVGEATGRLDLLGGVADYSGSLVLEIPTRCATTVRLEPADALHVGSVSFTPTELADLAALPYEDIRAALADEPKWIRYPVGVALVLVRHQVIGPPTGRLTIESTVPQSAGVSSSAALEVASARAFGADGDPLALAALCQEAENQVVGAPCGIMDQVAVAVGEPGAALPILCRPASVEPPVRLPPGYEVVGWPTGAAHDVAGAEYRTARTAAFMGKRIVEERLGRTFDWVSELPAELVADLPDCVEGAEFVDRWGTTDDPLSVVDEDVDYPVGPAAAFGGGEHRRCTEALAVLRAGEPRRLGELMAASHRGYDAMGLGHAAADAVAAEATDREGVVGARSSGGGCGGTVVVLARVGALDAVDGLIR